MNRMNLLLLLDRLDQLINEGTPLPLTGRTLIKADEALDLLDKIRNAIPEEVKRAEWLSNEKDRMMQESKAEAERILLQAEEYVAKLVSESEIVKHAQAEARRLVDESKKKAREIEAGANEYAEGVLQNLQGALERTLQVVKKGREELRR